MVAAKRQRIHHNHEGTIMFKLSKRNRRDITTTIRALRRQAGHRYAKWEAMAADTMHDMGLTVGLVTWDDVEDACKRFLATV